MTATDGPRPLARWTCSGCGEEVAAQDRAWVESTRARHRCPTPEMVKAAARITMALQGHYDG